MNIYLFIIIAALLLEFFLNTLSNILDVRRLSLVLPDEFKDCYTDTEYAKSQEYLKANTSFSYFTSGFDLLLVFIMIFFFS